MKVFGVIAAFLATLSVVLAVNWSPEDYEIFSLNDKIKQDLGTATTFYSWLGLDTGATLKDITKAYRKKSRALHPDKFSGSRKLKKQAEERFQRLSLVGNILRDQSLRKRYDYFLAKGFPVWKDTGYFYSKFRPGFFLTVGIIFILVSLLHMVALRINRKQDYKRVSELKHQIKQQAWGGSMIPPADGSDRKVMNEANGRLFLVLVDGSVNLIDTDENENQILMPLDENDINVTPGFKESLFYKVPCGIWNLTIGKLTSKTIDTSVTYENPNKKSTPAAESKKPAVKKAPRGEKIELPNGKVIYGRANGKTRSRKQK